MSFIFLDYAYGYLTILINLILVLIKDAPRVVFLPVISDNTAIKLMRKRGLWRYSKLMLLAVFISAIGMTGTVAADTSSSAHYQVSNTEFNAGLTNQSCSTQYCSQVSIGDLAAGTTASGSNTAKLGGITNSQPELEVVIGTGSSDLGVLSTASTATATTTVQVLSYLSGGYILQIAGDPPSYGTHTLATPSTPTASAMGTEQFGINLAANTTPNIGAIPVQTPSSTTSFGVVNTGYGTSNLFKYSNGDVIAHSSSASGITDYTVSMIINISNNTPAGHYSGDYSAIVTPVF
jgi:hypothetical protein